MYMLWNHHCVVEWVVIVTASDSCSFVATNQGQGNSVTKSSIIVQPINVSKVAGSNPAFAIFGAIFQVDFSSSVWGGRAVTSNFTGLVVTEAAFACKRTFLSIRDKVVEDVPPVLEKWFWCFLFSMSQVSSECLRKNKLTPKRVGTAQITRLEWTLSSSGNFF